MAVYRADPPLLKVCDAAALEKVRCAVASGSVRHVGDLLYQIGATFETASRWLRDCPAYAELTEGVPVPKSHRRRYLWDLNTRAIRRYRELLGTGLSMHDASDRAAEETYAKNTERRRARRVERFGPDGDAAQKKRLSQEARKRPIQDQRNIDAIHERSRNRQQHYTALKKVHMHEVSLAALARTLGVTVEEMRLWPRKEGAAAVPKPFPLLPKRTPQPRRLNRARYFERLRRAAKKKKAAAAGEAGGEQGGT